MTFILKKKLSLDNLKYQTKYYQFQSDSILYFLGARFRYNLINKLSKVLDVVYGIGYKKYILFFLSQVGYSFNTSILFLSVYVFQRLQLSLRNKFVNFDYRQYVLQNISNQKRYNLYSGLRHASFLPVRGQRSKTNARTQKRKYKLSLDQSSKRRRKRKR